MIAPDESTDWEDKFYYSFYELNNKKIIVLNHTEYWEKDKLVDNEFQCTYGKSELKNGTVRKYEFGNASYNDANAMSKEFFDYFESNPPIKELLANSKKPVYKILATGSDFEKKDTLKSRRYRWDNKKRVWWKKVLPESIEHEKEWLTSNVYGGYYRGNTIEIHPMDKYKLEHS